MSLARSSSSPPDSLGAISGPSQTSLASSADSSDASDAVLADADPGQCDTSFAFRPHAFVQKRYYTPTYCDICGGIVLGLAFKCPACGMRCHLGYGNNKHEDCRAEALWRPCGAPVARAKGSYHFGDVTLQKLRDIRSRARMRIVDEVVSEQKDFGKIDKLKSRVAEFGSSWGRVRINWLLLRWQLGTAALLGLVSYLLVRLSLRHRSPPKAHLLASMQAASNVAALVLVEGCLAVALYAAATGVKRNSALLHVFLCDMTKIDLADLGIDLKSAAGTAKRISSCTIGVTSVLLLVACAVWWQCLDAL